MSAARAIRSAPSRKAELQTGKENDMNPDTPERGRIDRDEIALLAYYAWERDGKPSGRDLQYWLEAEIQVRATRHLLAREIGVVPKASKPSRRGAARNNGARVA
jgi:hypothetical protein